MKLEDATKQALTFTLFLNMKVIRYLRFLDKVCHLFQFFISFRTERKIKEKFNKSKNIVIYRVGNIGDIATVINSLIFMKKIMDKKLILITSPGNKSGLSSQFFELTKYGIIDKEIIYYTDSGGISSVKKELKKYKDYPIYMMTSPLSSLFSTMKQIFYFRILGFKYITGWEIIHSKIFAKKINKDSVKFNNVICESERLLRNITSLYKTNYRVFNERIKSEIFKTYKLQKPSKTKEIILATGAKRATNRWDKNNYINLIRELTPRNEITLIGGEQEKEFAESLMKSFYDIKNKCNKLDIRELLKELSGAKLLICNDSGPQHIAALIHVPTIVTSSSRDIRGRWYPSNPNSRVLRNEFSCSACLKEECPKNNLCINSITVFDVISAMK